MRLGCIDASQSSGSCNYSTTERLLIYVFCIYLDLGQSGIFIDRKDVAEAGGYFLQSKGGTLRKGYHDLPIFFDELNDALKAHDAEEYGRIPPAPCARCSPVMIRRRKRSFIR
jgi:hypothetical protein